MLQTLSAMLHNFASFGLYFTAILLQYYQILNIFLIFIRFSYFLSKEKLVDSLETANSAIFTGKYG
jgi:hypothetical protein